MGMEKTPERKKREREARKRQEQRWARKSGRVSIRQMTDEERATWIARRKD